MGKKRVKCHSTTRAFSKHEIAIRIMHPTPYASIYRIPDNVCLVKMPKTSNQANKQANINWSAAHARKQHANDSATADR